MVKLKPLFFSILFTFLLFPLSYAFAQEEYVVDEDVMLYDTTTDTEDFEIDPRIESLISDDEVLNEISSHTINTPSCLHFIPLLLLSVS